jgi:hypothetical protein
MRDKLKAAMQALATRRVRVRRLKGGYEAVIVGRGDVRRAFADSDAEAERRVLALRQKRARIAP